MIKVLTRIGRKGSRVDPSVHYGTLNSQRPIASPMEKGQVLDAIDGYRDEMVSTLIDFCRIPALGPTSGGEGELRKAEWLHEKIESFGISVERHDSKDERVPSGIRPNLISRRGSGTKKLWLLAHLDIVPPGDLTKWSCDPFDPVVRNGKVYGRGVEDNGQSCIAALYALRALTECNAMGGRSLWCAWVSDEETGSHYGAQHLIREGLVDKNDWAIAPDRGKPDGNEIEIAEKNILWLRFIVHGKQAHASTPQKGLNAHRIGAELIGRLDNALHRRFRAKDPIFDPPTSTFEPTKKEANVPNINTIPAEDIFCIDCRILPRYRNKDVLSAVREQVRIVRRMYGTKVEIEIPQNESSPATPANSPLVNALSNAIRAVRRVEPRLIGVGGGTVGAFFRRVGVDTVVWETNDETAHTTDEYIRIKNLVSDSKVFALLALSS